MCGRYALYGPRSRSRAEAEYFATLEQFPGSWNVAPGQVLPITRFMEGAIEHVTARWGLVPYWAKDEKIGYKCINARSETALSGIPTSRFRTRINRANQAFPFLNPSFGEQ